MYRLFERDICRGITEKSAPLANYTNEVMASRFSDVMWLIEQIMWKCLTNASLVFSQAKPISKNRISSKSPEEIRNHPGNPHEVVTRMLTYFANKGMIKLSRGTIEIINEKKLEAITEG